MYTQLCSFDNLYQAFRAARRGKRNRPDVAAFERNLEMELFGLQEELASQGYRPGDYCVFVRYEHKRRLIAAAPFRDRVVHHALAQMLDPIFEPRFIIDSYASRPGKGTHAAVDRCQHFTRGGGYVLPLDVVQFFPAVDHAILLDQLAAAVPDSDVLWLCQVILDGGAGLLRDEYRMTWFSNDDLFAALRPRGLPIGNQTSQFWANVYLHPVDMFIRRGLSCRRYLRYCDDMLLFAASKEQLTAWRAAVQEHLARLRLIIHLNRAQPRPVEEGIPFLGFTIFPTHRRLKSRTGLAYRRRLRALAADYAAGRIPLSRMRASVMGWLGHARAWRHLQPAPGAVRKHLAKSAACRFVTIVLGA